MTLPLPDSVVCAARGASAGSAADGPGPASAPAKLLVWGPTDRRFVFDESSCWLDAAHLTGLSERVRRTVVDVHGGIGFLHPQFVLSAWPILELVLDSGELGNLRESCEDAWACQCDRPHWHTFLDELTLWFSQEEEGYGSDGIMHLVTHDDDREVQLLRHLGLGAMSLAGARELVVRSEGVLLRLGVHGPSGWCWSSVRTVTDPVRVALIEAVAGFEDVADGFHEVVEMPDVEAAALLAVWRSPASLPFRADRFHDNETLAEFREFCAPLLDCDGAPRRAAERLLGQWDGTLADLVTACEATLTP